MSLFAPFLAIFPWAPGDPQMQEINPQPWTNPGEDPEMQEINPQPWANPGAPAAVQQMSALPTPMQEQWGLYTQGSNPVPVLDVDTVMELKFADSSKVSDFPVEKGSFASYNKVIAPYQPKIKVLVGSSKDGQTSSQTRMQALLEDLFSEVRSTNIYDLHLPETFYEGVTVEKYDYKRTSTKGRGMLEVDITLMQVLEVTPQSTTVTLPAPAKPKAGAATNGGKAQPFVYTTADKLAIGYQAHGQNPANQGLTQGSDGHWHGNVAGTGSH